MSASARNPNWPANVSIGEANSGAMVNDVKTTPYSLGFMGFDYAITNHLQAAALQNASGQFLTPSLSGISLAIGTELQKHLLAGDFRTSFVDVAGAGAFNPADFEFFVVHRDLAAKNMPFSAGVRQAIKQFLVWSESDSVGKILGGQQYIQSIELVPDSNKLAHGFVPVPPEIQQVAIGMIKTIQS